MTGFDPYQMSAADGLPWLAAELSANPGVVVWPLARFLVAFTALAYLAVWAVVTLINRHPGEALPEPEESGTVPLTGDLSFAALVLAGRVPIEQTVEIRRDLVASGRRPVEPDATAVLPRIPREVRRG